MNAFHDISIGKNVPNEFPVLIENTTGSKMKYEIDKDSGLLMLDRVLHSSVVYPANYGFLPQTYCDDKDPLDAFVICQQPIVPMCLVKCRPIGVIKMIDKGEQDDKIIAVPCDDPQFKHVKSLKDLSPHYLNEISQFLLDYKTLEGKKVTIEGVLDHAESLKVVEDSIILYQKTFKK